MSSETLPVDPDARATARLQIVMLGGGSEFGLNGTAYRAAGDLVVVDCGSLFPDDLLVGVDRVLPVFEALRARRSELRGYLLTHGHEDHIGALPYALQAAPAPVYGTAFTLELVRPRLTGHRDVPRVDLVPLLPGQRVTLGASFEVEAIRVCHSIPEAVALALRTPAGLVLHTGDYKFAGPGLPALGTDVDRLAALGADPGVRVLVADSTGALTPGTCPAEAEVAAALDPVFAAAPGRVVVALFASHVERCATLAGLALRHGRRLAWDGRRLRESVDLALRLGLLRWPPEVVLPLRAVTRLPPAQQVIAVTGTQAEPASVLRQLARGEHPSVTLQPGDTVVVSARTLPGYERRVARLQDRMCQRGATIVDLQSHPGVHVSGHGHRDDLRRMVELTRPRAVVPVHGRLRMRVAHAALARDLGVAQVCVPANGVVLEVDTVAMREAGTWPTGRLYVEGKGVGDVEEPVLRDRRALAETGTVVALLVLDRATGQLTRPPELTAVGLVRPQEEAVVLAGAARRLAEAVAALPAATRLVPEQVSDRARRELRRYFRQERERRPVVIALVTYG